MGNKKSKDRKTKQKNQHVFWADLIAYQQRKFDGIDRERVNFGHRPDKISMRAANGSWTGLWPPNAILNTFAEFIQSQRSINQVLTKVDYPKQLTYLAPP